MERTRRAPFKFLDAYTREDRDIFFGRDIETEEIYSRLALSNILLMYGASGTGKTSLLQCGLAARVKDTDWKPVYIRRHKDLMRSLDDELNKTAVTPFDGDFSIIQKLDSIYLDYLTPVYLIFDQFEELFIFGDEKEIDSFKSIVRSIISESKNTRIILSIREEYLAYLSDFEEVIPDLFSNKIRIEKMNRTNAIEAIEGPCSVCDIEIDEDFAKQTIHKLGVERTGGIELTYLQVLLDNLYKNALKENAHSPRLNKENLQGIDSIDNILAEFLDSRLKHYEEENQVRQILKAFVSTDGTKRAGTLEDFQKASEQFCEKMSGREFKIVLEQLITDRILYQNVESRIYELRHDTLAKIIHSWMTRDEHELVKIRRLFESAYDTWLIKGLLPSRELFKEIEPYRNRLNLNSQERLFIEENRLNMAVLNKRNRFRKVIVPLISALPLVCLIYFLNSMYKSHMVRYYTLLSHEAFDDKKYCQGFIYNRLVYDYQNAKGKKGFDSIQRSLKKRIDQYIVKSKKTIKALGHDPDQNRINHELFDKYQIVPEWEHVKIKNHELGELLKQASRIAVSPDSGDMIVQNGSRLTRLSRTGSGDRAASLYDQEPFARSALSTAERHEFPFEIAAQSKALKLGGFKKHWYINGGDKVLAMIDKGKNRVEFQVYDARSLAKETKLSWDYKAAYPEKIPEKESAKTGSKRRKKKTLSYSRRTRIAPRVVAHPKGNILGILTRLKSSKTSALSIYDFRDPNAKKTILFPYTGFSITDMVINPKGDVVAFVTSPGKYQASESDTSGINAEVLPSVPHTSVQIEQEGVYVMDLNSESSVLTRLKYSMSFKQSRKAVTRYKLFIRGSDNESSDENYLFLHRGNHLMGWNLGADTDDAFPRYNIQIPGREMLLNPSGTYAVQESDGDRIYSWQNSYPYRLYHEITLPRHKGGRKVWVGEKLLFYGKMGGFLWRPGTNLIYGTGEKVFLCDRKYHHPDIKTLEQRYGHGLRSGEFVKLDQYTGSVFSVLNEKSQKEIFNDDRFVFLLIISVLFLAWLTDYLSNRLYFIIFPSANQKEYFWEQVISNQNYSEIIKHIEKNSFFWIGEKHGINYYERRVGRKSRMQPLSETKIRISIIPVPGESADSKLRYEVRGNLNRSKRKQHSLKFQKLVTTNAALRRKLFFFFTGWRFRTFNWVKNSLTKLFKIGFYGYWAVLVLRMISPGIEGSKLLFVGFPIMFFLLGIACNLFIKMTAHDLRSRRLSVKESDEAVTV